MGIAMPVITLVCPACKAASENSASWFLRNRQCRFCEADLSTALSAVEGPELERVRRVRLASPFIFR